MLQINMFIPRHIARSLTDFTGVWLSSCTVIRAFQRTSRSASAAIHQGTQMTNVVVLGLMFCLIFSCQSHASEKVRIGFILKTMQEERYDRDRDFFLSRAKELGAIPLFDSCHNDEMEQALRFENMLDSGVKVIVFQPVKTETADILVELAHKRGVRVVGYDSLPVNTPLDAMVMQDSWAVGKLQAEALVEWLKERKTGKVEGRVALIMGQPGDSNAFLMTEGATKVLEKHKGLDVAIQEAHEEWDPESAKKTTENVLRKFGSRMDAFICNNDGLAKGVIAALQDAGLDRPDSIFVAGADADLLNIRYIVEGKQTVDVWKMIRPLAEKAAEVAVTLAQNPTKSASELIKPDRMVFNELTDIPTIVTPVKLVSRDNIEQTLIAGGVYTWNQVYGNAPASEK